MAKVVFNDDYGGFGLSNDALDWLIEHGSAHVEKYENPTSLSGKGWWNGSRHDPLLVQCVEILGTKASDSFAHLIVCELKGEYYQIKKCDGLETVLEPNDLTWTSAVDGTDKHLVYCENCTTVREIIE